MMKKINKKVMMIILLILLISLSLGIGAYAAYVLNATEVQYTKADGSTVSVKAALDDLYANAVVCDYKAGDEVTVNGEPFFALYDSPESSDQVTLITKYNLGRTYGSDGALNQYDGNLGSYSLVPFSSSTYWSDGWTSGTRLDIGCLIGFDSDSVFARALNYGRKLGALSSRIMSRSEVEQIINNGTSAQVQAIRRYTFDGQAGNKTMWVCTVSESDVEKLFVYDGQQNAWFSWKFSDRSFDHRVSPCS